MRVLLLVDQHAGGHSYAVIAANVHTKIAPYYSVSRACHVTSVVIGAAAQAPQPLTVSCSVQQ